MIPRMVSVTGVKEWSEGKLRTLDDYLVGEEPLEIRVGDDELSASPCAPPATTWNWRPAFFSPKA